MKRVTFNEENNQIHILYVWLYAYKMARKGNWEQIAVDSERFRRRIKNNYEPILTKILNYNHREEIYKKLKNDDK